VPPEELTRHFTVLTYDRRGRGDIAVTGDGVPAAELAKITAPVLILGGASSPGWFQRSVGEQAAATPGAQLRMLDGFDHNAPAEVIAPIRQHP
jgi:pimeloyl-ACP methyl ester carboxylesterase